MKNLKMMMVLMILLVVILPFLSIWLRMKHNGYWRIFQYLGYDSDDDGSLLFKLQKENNERVKSATEYFEAIQNRDDTQKRQVDMVICIVSVHRDGEKNYKPRYLLQSAAAFHKEIRAPGSFLAAEMIICDVDAEEYPDADHLSSIMPVVARRNQQPMTAGLKLVEKEKQDYLFCLKSASIRYNASHILMIEDDVLPIPGLLNSLHHLLARTADRNIGFIKLYHPERLLGYLNPEPHRWAEWFGVASLTSLLYHYTCRPGQPSATIMFLHTILIMAMMELTGRQYFLWLLPTHSLVPAPDCCTQANIYPSSTVNRVMDWLEGVTCKAGYAKDYALVDMISKTDLESLYVQPNLVKHVGAYSSLSSGVNINI